ARGAPGRGAPPLRRLPRRRTAGGVPRDRDRLRRRLRSGPAEAPVPCRLTPARDAPASRPASCIPPAFHCAATPTCTADGYRRDRPGDHRIPRDRRTRRHRGGHRRGRPHPPERGFPGADRPDPDLPELFPRGRAAGPLAVAGASRRRPEPVLLRTLTVHTQTSPRHDVEPVEADRRPALRAHAEALGLLVERAQRIVDPVDETTFLAREQKLLLLLHRVRPLVREVERIGGQVPVIL